MATEWIAPVDWQAEGIEPSDNLKTNGFQAGYRPPAAIFNYQWHRTGECIKQLQTEVDTKSALGDTYIAWVKEMAGRLKPGYANGLSGETTIRTVTEGYLTHAWGRNSHAQGERSCASGQNSYAGGYSTYALGNSQMAVGKYNVQVEGATAETDATGSIFVIGVGTGEDAKANAFRVTNAGKCMGTSSFSAAGADYAEYYEWIDGNADNEDRRGCFVTLEGNKIRKATNEDDYILGVISATPSVVGNAHTDMWQGMYLTDVFGERLTEIVEVPERTVKIDDETEEVIPAHTETRFIINPEYDHTMQYQGRHERKEWAAVGTHGQLIVVDDGTCEVNHYCKVAENGTATKAEGKTEYRVIERIDDTHIKIVLK